MPELRWTLLIVGGLFILGLALWEIRRQRQAPRQSRLDSSASPGDRAPPSLDSVSGAAGGQSNAGFAEGGRVHREPIITLPELQPVDPRGEPRISARREPAHDPPVVEVDDASFTRLQKGAAESREPELAHTEDTLAIRADDDFDHIDADLRDAVARRAGAGGAADEGAGAGAAAVSSQAPSFAASASDERDSAEAATRGADEAPPSQDAVGFTTDTDDQHTAAGRPLEAEPQRARELEHSAEARAAGASAIGAAGAGPSAASAPIVDWPTDASRKIVALRLVSQPAARFPGRAVRQALAAEGFVLGKFDIFHKAGPDDRAVLSAASLTKPGTFAMSTIDGQRFGGLSLFAVLPGPLPPQEAFDELLTTARALNDRLQGALQDERGEPLTPMRSASIRQSLAEGNGSTDSGASAETAPAEEPQSETRQ